MKIKTKRTFDTQTKVVYNEVNHRNYTIKEVEDEIELIQLILDTNGFELGEIVGVYFNNRLRAACGRCSRINGKFYIEISSYYAKTGSHEFIRDTIAHEVIHTVKGCMNHGRNFKYAAHKLSKFGYNVETLNEDPQFMEVRKQEFINKPRWEIRCPNCGYRYIYYRKTKLIDRIANVDINPRIPCPDCHKTGLQIFHVANGMESKYLKITM